MLRRGQDDLAPAADEWMDHLRGFETDRGLREERFLPRSTAPASPYGLGPRDDGGRLYPTSRRTPVDKTLTTRQELRGALRCIRREYIQFDCR